MKSRRLFNTAIIVLVLLLPAVLLRLFTSFYPFLRTIFLSFRDYDIARNTNAFTGLANYSRVFTDITSKNSIVYTILFVVLSTFGEVILGLMVALILNIKSRFQKFSRTINLIPWAIAPIAGALIFRWIFDSKYGISNLLPSYIANIFSLSSIWGARNAVIVANIWKNTPFMAIIFLASMQSIPPEFYEAAKIDGANVFQIFRKITIPLIRPMITTVAILFIMWQLATFDIIYGMTGGGPANATEVLTHRVYIVAFGGLNFGYASAIGIVLFIAVMIIGIIGFFVWRKQEFTL